jgi:hypothetical protein
MSEDIADEKPGRGRPASESDPEELRLKRIATANKARADKIAAGYQVRQFKLSPDASAALEAIRAQDGDHSDTAVIERLLITNARRRGLI